MEAFTSFYSQKIHKVKAPLCDVCFFSIVAIAINLRDCCNYIARNRVNLAFASPFCQLFNEARDVDVRKHMAVSKYMYPLLIAFFLLACV